MINVATQNETSFTSSKTAVGKAPRLGFCSCCSHNTTEMDLLSNFVKYSLFLAKKGVVGSSQLLLHLLLTFTSSCLVNCTVFTIVYILYVRYFHPRLINALVSVKYPRRSDSCQFCISLMTRQQED